MLSVDGLRWDYYDRFKHFNLTAFTKLIQTGVQAEYLESVFPTMTTTNHYSYVTGLYPESSGILNNRMFDPVFNETFTIYNKTIAKDPKWVSNEYINADVVVWWGTNLGHCGVERDSNCSIWDSRIYSSD